MFPVSKPFMSYERKKKRFSWISKREHECLGRGTAKCSFAQKGQGLPFWFEVRDKQISGAKHFFKFPSANFEKNHWKMKWLSLKNPKAKTKLRIVSDPQHTAGKIAALRQLLFSSFRWNGHTCGFPSDTKVRTILNNRMINITKGKNFSGGFV